MGVVGGGVGGVRAARARREGVVTVEVQAWCAASVGWRVMREQKRRREGETKRGREGEKKRRERRRERRERREEEKRKKRRVRGVARRDATTRAHGVRVVRGESVVWLVMREKKRRREGETKRGREGEKKRRERRRERRERREEGKRKKRRVRGVARRDATTRAHGVRVVRGESVVWLAMREKKRKKRKKRRRREDEGEEKKRRREEEEMKKR